ncbi:hypothetical protein QUB63_32510 [Microcoleus sp. ARI1-B5]|uniref:hypothetical protein n=1 Tax=unclassified Microcoleus TaxID=2642155 RepID=UPI002FD51E06
MLIPALAAIFEADKDWLEQIHDSTHTQTLDPSQAIFPHLSTISYKTVYLHRIIAEQTIGRRLRNGEVVHHLDEGG